MILKGLAGVDFISANTDAQALKRSTAPIQPNSAAR
jgi:cell division GTPase FtsZ